MTYDEFNTLCIGQMEVLYAYAVRLTRSVPEAEDLVQATYSRALSRRNQLRDRSALRAWLFQILRGILFNERRRESISPLLQLVPSDDDPALADPSPLPDELVERMETAEVERALNDLPQAHRDAVLLADLWGFTYPEIARIVGCPVGTVRSRLHRARATLADALEDVARRHGYLKTERTPSGGET